MGPMLCLNGLDSPFSCLLPALSSLVPLRLNSLNYLLFPLHSGKFSGDSEWAHGGVGRE